MSKNPSSGTINLATQPWNFPLTYLNGPGLRYEIFVQGCPLRCTDQCLNPDLLDMRVKEMTPVESFCQHILELKAKFNIDGVTLLGGEPFAQATALASLCRTFHTYGLSVMTYSGYTADMLFSSTDPGWKDLLSVTDLLVDGAYLPQHASSRILWRGSRNQRILLLSDFYHIEALKQLCLFPMDDEIGYKKLILFEPYFGGTLIHWCELVEIEACLGDHTHNDQLPSHVRPWCPECAAQASGRMRMRKGIIVVQRQAEMGIYGFQEQKIYKHFVQFLEQTGVRIQPSRG